MRLIDADALKTIKSIQSADFNSIETIRQWIDSAPSIEIIRCGECKRANYEWSGVRCGLSDALMGEDGFCSIGERNE